MTSDELREAIASLPSDYPTKCEGLIRRLYGKVQSMEDKEKLLDELQDKACCGLSKELKDMMEKKGLALEGLVLVLKYLTNLPELAKYLYSDEGTDEEASLGNVRKRIGPEIEVLGGLMGEGIDCTNEWVKNLCKKAPSLRSLLQLSVTEKNILCQGASKKELKIVMKLVKVAESHQLSRVPHDPKLAKENAEKNSLDVEKLTKAKALMTEAKTMATAQATENKKELKDKLAAIAQAIEMPPDWYKQDRVSPDKLMQELDGIIKQCSNVVESSGSYNSDLEVVVKASGGRALCGIYHSKYEPSRTAGLPILLLPTDVSIFNPSKGIETNFMKFSQQGAAANYVTAVTSSSTNVGFAVGGFYGLFVGEAHGAYGSEEEKKDTGTTKSSTTSVSVLQYIWIAKKAFRIEQDQMRLSVTATEFAISIGKAKNGSEVARSFMKRYGSHVPAGVHELGGVFFSIADAKRQSSMKTSEFTEKAVERLQYQISFGFLGGCFGVGGSVKGEHDSSSGKAEGSKTEEESTSYTYSVKTIGPSASNPETFQKLLSYNSTWAIIDRGPPEGYIPVWELIRDLGNDFKTAADILEQTWKEDEKKMKEAWEHQQKKEKQQRKEEKEGKEKDVKMKAARKGLEKTKKEHMKRDVDDHGYLPAHSKILFTEDKLKRGDAYDKAIDLIMEDPEHNLCTILRPDKDGYTLIGWKNSSDTQMEFKWHKEPSILFFSEVCFKWKNLVPRRG